MLNIGYFSESQTREKQTTELDVFWDFRCLSIYPAEFFPFTKKASKAWETPEFPGEMELDWDPK